MPVNLIALDDEADIKVLYEHFFQEEIEQKKIEFKFFSDPEILLGVLPSINGPIILLTDLNMPKMSGYDLIEKVSGIANDLKIFVISAVTLDKNKIDSTKDHVLASFSKPLNFIELKEAVVKVL